MRRRLGQRLGKDRQAHDELAAPTNARAAGSTVPSCISTKSFHQCQAKPRPLRDRSSDVSTCVNNSKMSEAVPGDADAGVLDL